MTRQYHLIYLKEPAIGGGVLPWPKPRFSHTTTGCETLVGLDGAVIATLEVHHVMTRRRLMALRAIARCRGRMKTPYNPPLCRLMTSGVVASEQRPVRLAIAVTAGATQPVLFGRLPHPNSEKDSHLVHHLARRVRKTPTLISALTPSCVERAKLRPPASHRQSGLAAKGAP